MLSVVFGFYLMGGTRIRIGASPDCRGHGLVRIGADFLGPRLLGASLNYAFGEASAGEGGEEVGYYEGGTADEEDVFLGVDCLEGFFVGFGYSFGDQPAV